ncbi:MAG: exodeoxyribonuclease VII large subunit [Clostridia bacterium]|nr:exodeoxyribonuclease VII large subunit [Lachnospiraceae bacterium]NCC00262.1 exodeoxyribonuclease VII large subunit [Clostridia bacterium]NCD02286.1 exodeoxyribonuclease VII large subunit [Clostridia bacterium]
MKNVYSVSQVNQYIKGLISEDYFLNRIYVRGEVSNCKYHSSGHIYFTLKDRGGAIPCVMFAGSRSGLKFRMSEGQQVIVLGNISVYERDGRYQLYAREILMEGQGLLYQQYEALKKELTGKGYFAPEHKKPIPDYPERIGIVTARTGAAIQDMVNISTRRNPYVQLILYPALVQGEMAAASIVRGIQYLDTQGLDVIIIGRGGGSIEDLWAFNERIVAEAVYRCKTPVISAVGHETDVTIADFVADLRAPTPSAAAELAVPERREILQRISEQQRRLQMKMEERLNLYRSVLGQYQLRLKHASPSARLDEYRQRLMSIEDAMGQILVDKLKDGRYRLALYSERLSGLSPLKQLERGYALISREDGTALHSVQEVSAGDTLNVRLLDGQVKASVLETHFEGSVENGKE